MPWLGICPPVGRWDGIELTIHSHGSLDNITPDRMTATQFVIYGFALWRISSLFVNEEGPFHIFKWLRELAGIKHHDTGAIGHVPERFLAQALSCMWCLSLWVSFVFIPFFGFATAFALSAFAILIDMTIKRLQ